MAAAFIIREKTVFFQCRVARYVTMLPKLMAAVFTLPPRERHARYPVVLFMRMRPEVPVGGCSLTEQTV